MKNKKAGSMGLQVIIVLVVLIGFAIIYFFWLKDFRTSGENLSDYTICKNSNFENAKLKLKEKNLVLVERIGNKCKTEYLDVPEEENEVEIIAKKMAGCWDQYLEGREALFETKDNTYCAMCSVLSFDEEKEITGLLGYMMENEVPFKREFNYYEYLTRAKVEKGDLKLVKDAERDEKLAGIYTDRPWAVFFVQGKDVNPGSLTGLSSIQQAAIGGAAGAVAGGLIAVGIGLCAGVVSCVVGGPVAIAGAIGLVVVGVIGYFTGSDFDPDTDSRLLLWPYEKNALRSLTCTILEGQDQLEVKNY